MKIIKRGKLPGEKKYRAGCAYCDTVVEFQDKEAKLVMDQRDGNYLKVKCPVCKNDITIPARY